MWNSTQRRLSRTAEAALGAGRRRYLLDLGAAGGGKCVFELKRSTRARRLRLIVNSNGLTVVAPAALTSLREIEALLEPHKDWIRKKLEQVKLMGSLRGPGGVDSVPDKILLKGLEEEWRVEISDCSVQRVLPREGVVCLPRDFSRSEALVALRRWVLLRARDVLPRFLEGLAAEHGMELGRISVKEMKSRWGSCSVKGNINLNARILFLPSGLMQHIMLHELCHLMEMNHSKAFYERLRSMDPEADRHLAELREAWRMVPLWSYR